MDKQQLKRISLKKNPYSHNLGLHAQFTRQKKKIIRIEQILLKYKEILRKIIKKASLLHQTHRHQWDKIYDQVINQGKIFQQQSVPPINEMHYMNFIDKGTQNKLRNQARMLIFAFSQFQYYVSDVIQEISYSSLLKIYSNQKNRREWSSKYLDLQADEKVQQKEDKIKDILNKVEQQIPDHERAERSQKKLKQ